MVQAIGELVLEAHLRNVKRPIEGPDEQGAFPESGLLGWGLLNDGVPPVVVDANALRDEVIRACRSGRTVLVNAANAGALRLFAAGHVVEEVAEHAERWAQGSKDVSPAEFEAQWEREYLPLLRVIADEELGREMLDEEEQRRLGELEAVDEDDPPSVILSLALGAYFLSTDRRALEAVYGGAVNLDLHEEWAERLKPGGDAAELGQMVFAAVTAPVAVGTGLLEGVRWLASKMSSPWPLVPLGLGLIVLARIRVPPARWQQLQRGSGKMLLAFVEVYQRYL